MLSISRRFKRLSKVPQMVVAAAILAGGIGVWQSASAPTARASMPVDQLIAPMGAPASFADIIEAVGPAVVNISVSKNVAGAARPDGPSPQTPFPPGSPFEEFFRRFFERQSLTQGQSPVVQGMGSGFVVAPEGYVVTNNHVVQGADAITVTFDDGTRYEAKLQGTDPKTDLALLKIEADDPVPYARFGDSDSTRVGDWVIAIGNPFGLGGTATTGIVSARGRDIQAGPFDDFLQIDAPINRGNSGGPLFDTSGRVIGVNTAIFSPNGGSVGIGFAIPAAQAMPVIDQLRATGRIERGWLGVQIQAVTEDIAAGLGRDNTRGALVASVVLGSPAEKSGIRAGDVIIGMNGDEIAGIKDLARGVAEARPRDKAEIEVWRDGKSVDFDVVIGESQNRPDSSSSPAPREAPEGKRRLGLSLAPLTPDLRAQYRVDDEVEGALVVRVEPNSPAASKGLRPGDVVVMVGRRPVTSPAEAVEEIEKASTKERTSVLLQVERDGSRRFVAVPFA